MTATACTSTCSRPARAVWVQRLVIRGRRRELGLGGFPLVPLRDARAQALANRRLARAGGDPLAEKRRLKSMPTFTAAAEAVLAQMRPGWRNPKHGKDWLSSMERFAFPRLGKLPVSEVTSADVVETVRTSRAAPVVKLAFEFLVLTAARSGEVRGAEWAEIDTEDHVWTVPATRTKAKREHRVPLTRRAEQVLDAARTLSNGNALVFPSSRGKRFNDMALSGLLKTLEVPAVPHGFREAEWLALVCLHSGVFLRSQYLAFIGRTNPALAHRFIRRCRKYAVEQPWNGSRLRGCRIAARRIGRIPDFPEQCVSKDGL